jgi:hypothetical protein
MPLRLRHGDAADFHRGLPTGDINQPKSSLHVMRVRAATQPPNPSGSSWWSALERRSNAGSSRTPSRLACRTQTI